MGFRGLEHSAFAAALDEQGDGYTADVVGRGLDRVVVQTVPDVPGGLQAASHELLEGIKVRGLGVAFGVAELRRVLPGSRSMAVA